MSADEFKQLVPEMAAVGGVEPRTVIGHDRVARHASAPVQPGSRPRGGQAGARKPGVSQQRDKTAMFQRKVQAASAIASGGGGG